MSNIEHRGSNPRHSRRSSSPDRKWFVEPDMRSRSKLEAPLGLKRKEIFRGKTYLYLFNPGCYVAEDEAIILCNDFLTEYIYDALEPQEIINGREEDRLRSLEDAFVWALTDGENVWDVKIMTQVEADEASCKADYRTDGNMWWLCAAKHPIARSAVINLVHDPSESS